MECVVEKHEDEAAGVSALFSPLSLLTAPLAPQALETGDFGYRGDLLVVHGATEAGEPL